jgi:parallel beta-helix repeat protein
MCPRPLYLGFMFCMAVLGFLPSAFATTYYVSPSGSNSNSCGASTSQGTPKQTIAAGIVCMTSGDTLYIRGGTYAESLNTASVAIPSGTSWNNAVTISAYPSETVFITGGSGINITTGSNVSYVIFNGLHVDYGGCGGCDGNNGQDTFYVGAPAHHIRFQNGELAHGENVNAQGAGTFVEILNSDIHHSGYGAYITGQNWLIDGNTIHDHVGYGLHIYHSGGSDTQDNVVRNNIVYGNGFTDPRGIRGSGILLSSGPRNSAYNNVIYNNYGNGVSVNYGCNDCTVYNNTIYINQQFGIELDGSTGLIARNNILYQNGNGSPGQAVVDWQGNATADSNLIGTNPLFTNAGANDFTLQAGSAAIDTGVTLSSVTTDKLGVARPQGSAYDIGAYEFQGTSAVPTSLHIAQQPVSSPRTTTLPPITVQVLDQFGGLATNATASVTVALGANPGSATLSGTLTVTALGGAATFATLSLSAIGDGYTLTAAASGLAGDTSTPFDILPNTPITVYVSLPANSPAGSDARSCNVAQTLSTPLATIQKGLSCLVWPGSTLLVRGGTYVGVIDTGAQPVTGGTDWSTPTTIAAFPNETVTVQAPSTADVILLRNGAADHYLVFDRLILDGASIPNTHGFVAYSGVHHVRFQRGEIKNTGFELIFIHQANSIEILTSSLHGNTLLDAITVESTSDSILISGNDIFAIPERGICIDAATGANFNALISGNRVHGTGTGSAVPAIVVGRGSNALVVNNLVYSNAQGISVGVSMDAAQVWHNTVYGNTGVGVQVASGATNTQVKNTIVSGNGSALTNAGTGTLFATNLCDGAGTGCGVVGSPLFVNAGAADFHLQAGSPARNAGSVLATVLTDFASLPRPSGAGYDIGAYEYQESAAPRLAAIIAFQ